MVAACAKAQDCNVQQNTVKQAVEIGVASDMKFGRGVTAEQGFFQTTVSLFDRLCGLNERTIVPGILFIGAR